MDHKHHKRQEGLFDDTNQGSGRIQSIEKQEKDAQRGMLSSRAGEDDTCDAAW